MASYYEIDFPVLSTADEWKFVRDTCKMEYGKRAGVKMDIMEWAIKGLYSITDVNEIHVRAFEIYRQEWLDNCEREELSLIHI